MKLSDISMEDLINSSLLWSDFEEDPENKSSMKELIASDFENYEKILFLNQVENGELLDKESLQKLDFYEVDFTEYARWFIAKGQYRPDDSRVDKDVEYSKDFSNLKLLIQDLGNQTFLLYLRDYSFGLIQPLGYCEIEYGSDFDETTMDRGTFFREHSLSDIQLELWESGLDLEKEIYDYYHNLPDVESPLIRDLVNIDNLLTVKDAAKKLDVSEARVKKMVSDKILEGFKFGNKLLISSSSVQSRIMQIEESGKPTRGKIPGENPRKSRAPKRNSEDS